MPSQNTNLEWYYTIPWLLPLYVNLKNLGSIMIQIQKLLFCIEWIFHPSSPLCIKGQKCRQFFDGFPQQSKNLHTNKHTFILLVHVIHACFCFLQPVGIITYSSVTERKDPNWSKSYIFHGINDDHCSA